MSVAKEILGDTVVFTLGEIYTLSDFIYFWDMVMKDTPELEEVLSAKHIIIDCTKLKGVEQTAGEIFFLQQKFERRNEGRFSYCGLGAEQKRLFTLLSGDVTKSAQPRIQNFLSRQEAMESILAGDT